MLFWCSWECCLVCVFEEELQACPCSGYTEKCTHPFCLHSIGYMAYLASRETLGAPGPRRRKERTLRGAGTQPQLENRKASKLFLTWLSSTFLIITCSLKCEYEMNSTFFFFTITSHYIFYHYIWEFSTSQTTKWLNTKMTENKNNRLFFKSIFRKENFEGMLKYRKQYNKSLCTYC